MSRLQRALLIILVIQVLVIAVVYWPRGQVANAGDSLFGSLSTDKIVSMVVDEKDKNHVELYKEGTEWQLKIQDGGYPVSADKIKPVLEKVLTIQTNRLVTRTATSQKQLQVAKDDFVRRVQLTTADSKLYTLYLGSSPGVKATHVRLEGQDEVYLTDRLTAYDVGAEASSWINTTYLSIPIDQITRVSVKNANGIFEFEKDTDNKWTMKGLTNTETLDSGKLDSTLTRLSSLNMTTPLGQQERPEYGMASSLAKVTLITKSDTGEIKTITLVIGAENPDDKTYIVKSSESKYYVKIAGYNVQDFVNLVRSYFIQATPTPQASPVSLVTASPEVSPIPASSEAPTQSVTPTPGS